MDFQSFKVIADDSEKYGSAPLSVLAMKEGTEGTLLLLVDRRKLLSWVRIGEVRYFGED